MMTRRDAALRYAAATLLTQANDDPARRLQHERSAHGLLQEIPVAYLEEWETLTVADVLALAAVVLRPARPTRRGDPRLETIRGASNLGEGG